MQQRVWDSPTMQLACFSAVNIVFPYKAINSFFINTLPWENCRAAILLLGCCCVSGEIVAPFFATLSRVIYVRQTKCIINFGPSGLFSVDSNHHNHTDSENIDRFSPSYARATEYSVKLHLPSNSFFSQAFYLAITVRYRLEKQ